MTLPPVKPAVPPSNVGFVENAERLNSRAAMVRLGHAFSCKLLLLLLPGLTQQTSASGPQASRS